MTTWCQDNEQKPYYLCNRAQGKIKIDGNIDEAAWKYANEMNMIRIISLDRPVSETKVYSLYDDKYIYFAFMSYDTDIWTTNINSKRDSQLWLEDAVEIFLKPNVSEDTYYEFQISPKNVILDVFLANSLRPGNMFFRFAEWNCSGLRSATRIKGTLNRWNDTDEYWTCEVAIPFSDLPSVKDPPVKGDTWLFNVARYDYSIYLKKGVEVLSFSRITKLEFHDFNEWAFLKFN
ncbi:MAG: carbohydrate-binding family 9-like protein [bacterium]|nr:carbohydrate-binding family 9-like protein [bacterium]